MPRRNHRGDEPEPITITPAGLARKRHQPNRKAQTPVAQPTRRAQRREDVERKALLNMHECAWPGCPQSPKRDPKPLPVCWLHAVDIACSMNDDISAQPKVGR